MKKTIVILLSLLILLNTSGFSVTIKYCPIKNKTSFSFEFKKSCCAKKNKKCCTHKKISFKKINDPTFEKAEIKISDVNNIILSIINTNMSSAKTSTNHSTIIHASPHVLMKRSRSILYRAILI